MPALVQRVAREAASIDVAAVRMDRRDLEEDLQSGELDAALDVALPLSAEVRRELLRSEPMVVLVRTGHPAVRDTLALETYLAQEHVLITGRRRGGGHEDVALGRLGMSRRIRVRCQQHVAASEIVSQSDLLATMSRSQAQLANLQANRVLPFPVEIPPMEMFLYWHANVDADPASQWFRRLVLEVFGLPVRHPV